MNNEENIKKLLLCKKIVEDSKFIRNSIKRDITTSFNVIANFIKAGPGVVSIKIASDTINHASQLIGSWVTEKEGKKEILTVLDEIKEQYYISSVRKEEMKREEKFISDREKESKELDKENIKLFGGDTRKEDIPFDDPTYIRALRPSIIMKGDVSYLPIGPVQHYCLVYKVIGDVTYVIPITSNKADFEGKELSKSRFLKGKAIYALHQLPTTLVRSRFVMPYDSKTEANQIIKETEEYIKQNILPRTYTKKKGKKK